MTIPDIISIVLAFASIAWFMWFVTRPHNARKTEDKARAFYDRHGYWPDEEPPKA
jgi:hypothetical protein